MLRKYAYDWAAWLFFAALPLLVFQQNAGPLAEQGAASGGPMANAAIYPAIIAWVMIGLAAVNLLRILGGRLAQGSAPEPTPTTRLALWATLLVLVYLLALPWLGYYLSTPLMLAIFFVLLGLRLPLAVAGALAMTLVVAAVFEGLLNVVLPLGIFKFTLFG